MRTATTTLLAAAATAAIFNAASAYADPIVNQIDVAVDLANLPAPARGLHINCDVCTADCRSGGTPPATVVSAGYAEQVLTAGAFHGTISVPMTPLPQAGNAVGTAYLCALLLVDNSGEVNLGSSAPAWAQPQSGTTYTPVIQGTIAGALANPVTP